jgi:flagellar motor component MotA
MTDDEFKRMEQADIEDAERSMQMLAIALVCAILGIAALFIFWSPFV